jgi:hypothetical protein
LIAKRTSEKFGIIINSNIRQQESLINIKNFFNRLPSNILMITNILYPHEIDDEAYYEIKNECESIGTVKDLKFFVFNDPLDDPGESVRVFIEFVE